MIFFLNLLFAILAFLLMHYILTECQLKRQLVIVLAIIVAIIVFLLDLASHVL